MLHLELRYWLRGRLIDEMGKASQPQASLVTNQMPWRPPKSSFTTAAWRQCTSKATALHTWF